MAYSSFIGVPTTSTVLGSSQKGGDLSDQVLPEADVLLHEMCCSMKSNPSLLGMMTCSQGGGQQRTNASAHTDDPARQVWSEQVRGVVRSPRAAVAAQGLLQASRIGASGRGTNG